jgi:hypothetical protein
LSYRSFNDNFEEDIPAGSGALVYHPVFRITEPGKLLYLLLFSEYKGLEWKIFVDGKEFKNLNASWIAFSMSQEMPDVKGGICLAGYDDVNDFYCIGISIPLKWETSFEVKVRNPTIAVELAVATIFYDRLAEFPLPKPEHDIQTPLPRPDPVM